MSTTRTTSRPSTTSRAARSRTPYVLAAVVAVLGTVVAAVWCGAALVDQVQRPADFARAAAPGSVSVTLTRTGPHLVYAEVPRDEAVPDLVDELRVTDPAGDRIDVLMHDVGLQYDVPGGHLATSVAVFDAERTGTYLVTVDDGAALPTGAHVAVGDDLAPDLLRAVVLPALTALLSLGAGLTLALTTWLGRRSQGGTR